MLLRLGCRLERVFSGKVKEKGRVDKKENRNPYN